jgi:hypothetical protein
MVAARSELIDAKSAYKRQTALLGTLQDSATKGKASVKAASEALEEKRVANDEAEQNLKEARSSMPPVEWNTASDLSCGNRDDSNQLGKQDQLDSVDACKEWCGDKEDCTGMVFHPDEGCYGLNSPCEEVADEGWTSASKLPQPEGEEPSDDAKALLKVAIEAAQKAADELLAAEELKKKVATTLVGTNGLLNAATTKLAMIDQTVTNSNAVFESEKKRMRRFEEGTVKKSKSTASRAKVLVTELEVKMVEDKHALDQKQIDADLARVVASKEFKEGMEEKLSALNTTLVERFKLLNATGADIISTAHALAAVKQEIQNVSQMSSDDAVRVEQVNFDKETADEESANAAAVNKMMKKLRKEKIRLGSSAAVSNDPSAAEAKVAQAQAEQSQHELKMQHLKAKKTELEARLKLGQMREEGEHTMLQRLQKEITLTRKKLNDYLSAQVLEEKQKEDSRIRQEAQKAMAAKKVLEEGLTNEQVARMDLESDQQRVITLKYRQARLHKQRQDINTEVTELKGELRAAVTALEAAEEAMKEAVDAVQQGITDELEPAELNALAAKKKQASNTVTQMKAARDKADQAVSDKESEVDALDDEEENLLGQKEEAEESIKEAEARQSDAELAVKEREEQMKEDVKIETNVAVMANNTEKAAELESEAKERLAELERQKVQKAMQDALTRANETSQVARKRDAMIAAMVKLQRTAVSSKLDADEAARQLTETTHFLAQLKADQPAARQALTDAVVRAQSMVTRANKAVVSTSHRLVNATAHEVVTIKERDEQAALAKAALSEGGAEAEELRIAYEALRLEQEQARQAAQAAADAEAAMRMDQAIDTDALVAQAALRASQNSHDLEGNQQQDAEFEAELQRLMADAQAMHEKALALADQTFKLRLKDQIAQMKKDLAENAQAASEAVGKELESELKEQDAALQKGERFVEQRSSQLATTKSTVAFGNEHVEKKAQEIKKVIMDLAARKEGEPGVDQAKITQLKEALESQRLAGIESYKARVAMSFAQRSLDATTASITRITATKDKSSEQMESYNSLLGGLQKERENEHSEAGNLTALVLARVQAVQRNATVATLKKMEDDIKLQLETQRADRLAHKAAVEGNAVLELQRTQSDAEAKVGALHGKKLMSAELKQHIETQLTTQNAVLEGAQNTMVKNEQELSTKQMELAVSQNQLSAAEEQLQTDSSQARKQMKDELQALSVSTASALDRATTALADEFAASIDSEERARADYVQAARNAAASEAKHTAGEALVARLQQALQELHRLDMLANMPGIAQTAPEGSPQPAAPARRLLTKKEHDELTEGAIELNNFIEAARQLASSKRQEELTRVATKLAAAKVELERSLAADVTAEANAAVSQHALEGANTVTTEQMNKLTEHLLAHKDRAAYMNTATALGASLQKWRHAWLARASTMPANGRMLATLESQVSAAQGILGDAIVQYNNQKALVDRLEAKLNESSNNEQLNQQALQLEESRLAAKDSQLGVLKSATADVQQDAAATSADLAAKKSAADANTAERMLQEATNHYKSAIQHVKQQMVAERQLSDKIGHTEGKIEAFRDKMEQLDSSLNEANADFAEQQAALQEATKAQQFAIAEDKATSASVAALAKQLGIPEERQQRETSLTITSSASKTLRVDSLPGSVSATPVFLRALEDTSKQAELEVGVNEAKRLYTKLTLVREQTFAKLEAQRAKTSLLSEAVARAGSKAGKIEAEVHGLEDKNQVVSDEMTSDQNQMNQTSVEQAHVQQLEDEETTQEAVLNDQLADAQTNAMIAAATQQEEQHNLLIEEDFATQQSSQQNQLASEEKAHISTLGPKVDAARQKAIALAAAVDNTNTAATEASQAKAVAKELLATAQVAAAGVALQAGQVESDAQNLYNRTAEKISDTEVKVSELTTLSSAAYNKSRDAAVAARINVDVNMTLIGLYASGVAKRPFSDGIVEAIAEVTGAAVEGVKIDVLTPCNVLEPREIPYCTLVYTHAELPMYDAAATAVSAIEAKLELDGEDGLAEVMTNKWRIKGKFASVKLLSNGTDVHDPVVPYQKPFIDTGEDENVQVLVSNS